MKTKRALLAGIALAFAASLSWAADPIRIRGSDTLGAKLVPQLAEAYQAAHPAVRLEIAAEGSMSAFSSLLDGTADIGMSSRAINPEEAATFSTQGIKLDRRVAALDAWAIIVNAANPIDGLTSAQVEAIFTGDVGNWSAVGGQDLPIQVHTRNTSSGIYLDFRRLAMRDRPYNPRSQKISSNPPTVSVGQNAGGISYVGIAYLPAPGIKALKIDTQAPTEEARKTYSYIRECCYFIRSDVGTETRAFLEWATGSPGAKKIIRKVGFFPPE